MSGIYDEAIARLAAKKAQMPTAANAGQTGQYIEYPRPRPISGWVIDGEVVEGLEIGGRALPYRVMDAPAMYVVQGETRYPDGRWFLDFAMNPAWIEASTDYRFKGERYPSFYCPDCDGKSGEHIRVEIPSKAFGKSVWVKCPRDTSGRAR